MNEDCHQDDTEATNGSSQAAPIDWEQALECASGRRGLLMELIEIFLSECPSLVDEIGDAITRGSAKGLTLVAHRLKGSLRYFGDSDAAERARELEDMGRAQRMDDAESKFAELRTELDRLLPVLRAGP